MKAKKLVYVICLLIGIILIIVGFYLGEGEIRTLIIVLGSAIIGASFSNLFSLVGINIYEILKNSQNLPLLSKGEEIDNFRKKYYHYYQTRKGGNYHWRMYIIDQTEFKSNEYLSSNLKMKDDEGRNHIYESIALICKSRLIRISSSNQGHENSVIQIFPEFSKSYSDLSIGLSIFENWDGDNMLAPAIISTKPINGIKKIGKVVDTEDEKHLNNLIKGYLDKFIISEQITKK